MLLHNMLLVKLFISSSLLEQYTSVIWFNLQHDGKLGTYYERSEFLIDGDRRKVPQKVSAVRKKRAPRRCNYWPIISLNTTVRTVLPFPSILAPEILPASDSELRPRHSSGVHLAYTDHSGERQRAPFALQQWGPPSLHRSSGEGQRAPSTPR